MHTRYVVVKMITATVERRVNEWILHIDLDQFLASSYVPRDQLSGWLETVAAWNPVTYLLEGLRSIVVEGWVWRDLASALAAIAGVGALSMTLCFAALRGRIRRG